MGVLRLIGWPVLAPARLLAPRGRRAVLALAAAWALMTAGAWLAWGVGYGLMVAGAALAAYVVTLFDVDEEPAVEETVRLRSDLPEPVVRLAALSDRQEGL